MPLRSHAMSLGVAAVFALVARVEATTWYVASHGVDGPGCGSKESPCRSISQTIANAVAGDKIIVGPGRYGELNDDLMLGGPGEETPAPGCGCVLALNKPVSLTSSDGAAATIIQARGVDVSTNVLIITDGGEFGKPGKGFTVTGPGGVFPVGIAIDANNVAVRGNQVVRTGFSGSAGIRTVNSPGVILIEGNQVMGWDNGIDALGGGKTVRKNSASLNFIGISNSAPAAAPGVLAGNVSSGNGIGIAAYGAVSVLGNAVRGNRWGFRIGFGFTGSIAKNDVVANWECGLENNAVSGLPAADNYWGAATGPAPGAVCDITGGSTVTTPFAAKPFGVKARIKP